jgi:cytochrome c556
MEGLMKQVQFLNSRLKRGVKGSKLKSQADKTTAYAATLAAIAQATISDTSDVENTADLDKWYQFCADMRDAAGEVNQAIHRQNEDEVKAAMKKLKASCDDCHAVFEEDQL